MSGEISVNSYNIVEIQGKDSGDSVITYVGDDGSQRRLEVPRSTTAGRDVTDCDGVRLINAALGQGFTISGDGATRSAVRKLESNCPTERLQWPPEMGEIDPNEPVGAHDAPPKPADTPASQLGAPAPKPSVTVSTSPPPGGSDGRTLTEQYTDPLRPLQDDVLRSILLATGISPADLDRALDAVRHNEPPEGERHPVHGNDDRARHKKAADPVTLFTGQFTLSVTDFQIESRGFPLELRRIYKSGEAYFGPWGFNWDHNYNVYLRPLTGGGAAIWTGELREEVYSPSGAGSFEPPIGVFRMLELQQATAAHPERYVLLDREGFQYVFSTPPGWPLSGRIPLTELRDRHQNAHVLRYDAEGRIERVEDHAGRFLEFHHGDCGLLESVSDHTGRTWRYFHDTEVEHLSRTISPATPDYPEGILTQYEYDAFQAHPALRHNLVRVIDGDRRVIAENEYGADPESDNFARVRRQRWAGFQAEICATQLQLVPRTPDAINVPALRVEANEDGVIKVYTFNYRGDLLDERHRLFRDGSLRVVAYMSTYDEQGNCILERLPNGRRSLYTFDHENPDPRARGNLLKVERAAPPSHPLGSRIVQVCAYEPVFHRLRDVTDEAGRKMTLRYDYELGLGTVGDVVRVEHPKTTLPDGSSQSKVEQLQYDAHGNLTMLISGHGHRHRLEYGTTAGVEGLLLSVSRDVDGSNEQEFYEYDLWGNLASVTDGLGNKTEFQYNALRLLTSARRPAVAGARAEVAFHHTAAGLVRREEVPRGAFDDGVIADAFIANEYGYDAAGNLTSATLGANTGQPRIHRYRYDDSGALIGSVDPLGRKTRIRRDERGLPLAVTSAVGTEDESTIRSSYDRNGRLLRRIDPYGCETDFTYDAWDRLKTLTLPGEIESQRTVHTYFHGSDDRVIRARVTGLDQAGQMKTLFEAHYDLDERGRLFRYRKGAQQRTQTFDADDRVIARSDHRGATQTFTYDGLDRRLTFVDPLGNSTARAFDPAGNLTDVEQLDRLPDGTTAKLSIHLEYDERGRAIGMIDSLGRSSTAVYDDRDLIVQRTDPLGRTTLLELGLDGELSSLTLPVRSGVTARHATRFDAVGRSVAYVDPEGRETRYSYDARSRLTGVIHADGRARRFRYDGRTVREETPGGTVVESRYDGGGRLARIDLSPAPGSEPTPPVEIVCDGLGRAVRITQGTASIARAFDAEDRLLRESDGTTSMSVDYDDLAGIARLHYPDGRVDRLTFDLAGRLSEISLEAVGAMSLTGPLAAGATIARYRYRGSDSSVLTREVAFALTTEYDYDPALRLVGLRHRSGAAAPHVDLAWVYDAGDRRRLAWSAVPPQVTERYSYDALSRLQSVESGMAVSRPPQSTLQADADAVLASVGALGAPFAETYTLNLADARTSQTQAGTVTTYDLDETYRIVSATRPAGAPVPFEFDADGRCVKDELHRYRYDAFGRLVEIQDLASTVLLRQTYDPAGRVVLRAGAGSLSQRWFGSRCLQVERVESGETVQFTGGLGPHEVLIESSGENRFPLQDAAGTILGYVDESGAVLERYRYTPFGTPSFFAPDGATPRASSAIGGLVRFAGYPRLLDVLWDARARAYDSSTGRFLQPDGRGLTDTANLYTYAQHNPIDFVDPNGEWGLLALALIGLTVGAVLGGASVFAAKPEATALEIFEGAAVGGVAGLVSGLTFGTMAPELAAAGYGVITTGVLAGGASGAAGGAYGGVWYGGSRAYVSSGGDVASTVRGAAYGGVKGASTGLVSGAVTGGVTGRVWSGVVRQGALASGEAAAIRRGAPAPPRPVSPASFLGNTALGAAGGVTGAAAQTGAESAWNAAAGEPVPTAADWQRSLYLGAAGGVLGSTAQRYVPGTGMNRYARKYQLARTQEGVIAALSYREDYGGRFWLTPRFQATEAYRRAFGIPRVKGAHVHHDRAVAAYPELFDDFDIMTWMPDEEAHYNAHLRNSDELGLNWTNSLTHGPKTPRFPGMPAFPPPLGAHEK